MWRHRKPLTSRGSFCSLNEGWNDLTYAQLFLSCKQLSACWLSLILSSSDANFFSRNLPNFFQTSACLPLDAHSPLLSLLSPQHTHWHEAGRSDRPQDPEMCLWCMIRKYLPHEMIFSFHQGSEVGAQWNSSPRAVLLLAFYWRRVIFTGQFETRFISARFLASIGDEQDVFKKKKINGFLNLIEAVWFSIRLPTLWAPGFIWHFLCWSYDRTVVVYWVDTLIKCGNY